MTPFIDLSLMSDNIYYVIKKHTKTYSSLTVTRRPSVAVGFFYSGG
ncbi:hypothetical protein LCGC14_0398840 [marine sediment metagenome]|uniref:Uncharacterized protein n=1 Tax=marine sediment metagenome TaxID=412755 RepID=A0A0F9W694_9ZZZZ